MTDMTDHKAIREALEAGPTEGPWFEHHDKGHLYIENQRDDVVCDMGLRAKSSPTSQFIAACNPSAIRALLADLDAARAAISEAKAGGWQPIETAPKDGTEVLCWREDCGQFIASYTSMDAMPLTQDEIDATDEETLFAKDWFTQWPQSIRLDGSETPTKWQPLPAPPAQKDNT